jgi:hypothetical protein
MISRCIDCGCPATSEMKEAGAICVSNVIPGMRDERDDDKEDPGDLWSA